MKLERRNLLARAAALAGGVWLARSLSQVQGQTPVDATVGAQTIFSQRVRRVPAQPEAPEWGRASPVDIPLSAQVVVKPRHYESGVKSLRVRCLYDDQNLGFLLEWQDPAEDKGLGKVNSYRDAVALQFPADPTKPIPHFAMGQPDNPVLIYQWKADWQFGPLHDVDDEFGNMWVDFYPYSGKGPGEMVEAEDYAGLGKPPFTADKAFVSAWWAGNPLADPLLKRRTPVEKLTAAGFGTLTSLAEQDGGGRGLRRGEGWAVVVTVPRSQPTFEFAPGQVVPVNFAAWEGSNQERGAEKAVSTWNWLALKKPLAASDFFLPALMAAALGALQWVLVRRLGRTRP